jgi:hypothetical protein
MRGDRCNFKIHNQELMRGSGPSEQMLPVAAHLLLIGSLAFPEDFFVLRHFAFAHALFGFAVFIMRTSGFAGRQEQCRYCAEKKNAGDFF